MIRHAGKRERIVEGGGLPTGIGQVTGSHEMPSVMPFVCRDAMRIEKPDVTLGIVPLTDCAPIAVGVERGFFQRKGLQVATTREGSWSSIRDKVAYGILDGAQMIAPMTLATTLGVGGGGGVRGVQCEMVTGINLDLNGNAITLSCALMDEMASMSQGMLDERQVTAYELRRLIEWRHHRGMPRLRFGIVYPVSTHSYELRYWLASVGIDPDRDVDLVVVPPPRMVDAMRDGDIVGFCVGEPWNSVAVATGVGCVAITKYELWNNSPEKVLGVTRAWALENPGTHLALIEALIECCRWIDEPENRDEVAAILSLPQYVGVDASVIARSMTGTFMYAVDQVSQPMPDFNVFYRYAANYPWRSHAKWFLTQMLRWGQIDHSIDMDAVACAVYQPELYRQAAARLGLAAPNVDEKTEGEHGCAWDFDQTVTGEAITMGADLLFDGQRYDPGRPLDYLQRFSVKQLAVTMGELAADNGGGK